MAVLAFSAVQDAVSYRVFSNAYSSLETFQSSIIASAGANAYGVVSSIGQYLDGPLTDDPAPASWEAWLTAEATAIAIGTLGDGRASEVRKHADRAREVAINTYDFTTSDDNTAGPITLLEIRRYVGITLSRRGVYPDLRIIDWATKWAVNYMWHLKNWSFKQRPVVLTIATNSAVTVSNSITLDSLNTADLWYTDSTGANMSIKWCDADLMARLRATETDTGRPTKFRTYLEDGALVWQFHPAPDIAYTVRTESLIVGPPAITDKASETPFAQFPASFTPGLQELVLAKVEDKMQVKGSRASMEMALSDMEALFPQYLSIGKPVEDGWTIRDVNGDFSEILENGGLY